MDSLDDELPEFIPDEVRLEASRRLVVHVQKRMLPYLVSRIELAPRGYAAAALARCAQLLGGTQHLYDNAFGDLGGCLLRPLVECWYLGLYFLLAPDEAYKAVLGAHAFQLGKLDETWGHSGDFVTEHADVAKGLNWFALAARVGKLAEAAGEAGGLNSFTRTYEVLYRGESLMSVHGGLGTLQRYLDIDASTTSSARKTGREPDGGAQRIITGAALVGVLATYVAREFGLGTTELDSLRSEIARPSERAGEALA